VKIHKILSVVISFLMMVHSDETGAIKVKPIEGATTKWAERARTAATEFAENAEAAANEWATNTGKASDTYGLAIAAPGIKERFRRGVARAGAAKFARKIRDVGADRFAPGVAAATVDYKAGAEPYFSTIAALTLSTRKPRGDPANYRRVEEVGKALNAKRLALLGATAGGGA